jgi:2-keto-4-pentenoate hydratase/2-oxohepta-3-ene-1,7-dioic acid hydratase in catechol pathway
MRAALLRPALVVACVCATLTISVSAQKTVTKYVRYSTAGATSYGVLEGETIRELRGDIFTKATPTGQSVKLADVKLLAKYPTSIIATGENIVIPADSKNIHYEGELVLVIGKTAKHVPKGQSAQYIFGVTAGNDVSERDWQTADLQWFRAKASDTFGPLGPAIVTGLNYNDLLLQTRLNGEVVQSERTKDLLFDVDTIISYVSTYITLEPGDVIFTGTPQTTKPFKEGDTIEVEVEGVGILRNKAIRAAR